MSRCTLTTTDPVVCWTLVALRSLNSDGRASSATLSSRQPSHLVSCSKSTMTLVFTIAECSGLNIEHSPESHFSSLGIPGKAPLTYRLFSLMSP